jgi:hypothetical protein
LFGGGDAAKKTDIAKIPATTTIAAANAKSGVYATPHQLDLAWCVLDRNGDGEISAEELHAIATAHATFFARHVPRFGEPTRNVMQQWMWCMQQKE